MDANRLRFYMLADAPDWVTESSVSAGEVCLYDAKRRTLRLGSLGESRTFDEALDLAVLEPRLARVPGAVDAFGTWAWWDDVAGQVRAAGGGAGTTLRFEPAQVGLSGAVTDLSPGSGGILYLAVAQRVVALHLRKVWSAVVFPAEGIAAHRIAADPRGGAYVLSGPPSFAPNAPPAVLGRVDGQPLPDVLSIPSGAGLFRPMEENPDPPRTRVLETLAWPGEVPVALACDTEGRLAVLSWVMDPALAGVPPDAAHARLRFYTGRFSTPVALPGVLRPFSLAILPDGRAAVLSLLDDGKVEAVAYALPAGASEAIPQGDYFPLPGHDGGPFSRGRSLRTTPSPQGWPTWRQCRFKPCRCPGAPSGAAPPTRRTGPSTRATGARCGTACTWKRCCPHAPGCASGSPPPTNPWLRQAPRRTGTSIAWASSRKPLFIQTSRTGAGYRCRRRCRSSQGCCPRRRPQARVACSPSSSSAPTRRCVRSPDGTCGCGWSCSATDAGRPKWERCARMHPASPTWTTTCRPSIARSSSARTRTPPAGRLPRTSWSVSSASSRVC
ncbi:hypothetical protein QEG98_24240 [Myxococcus sp. MxC21-1]|uniref:hypothetical protein n=1 Tax=Myxococcus sp. MxC21-1 TaxID=3041439 RepID=UPI00292FC46D|nr:hypothetical protein [Myxococcus sp. MxC21-1]WNZ59199.1 hypothetical protein QEG98_24240 [Myxococcus sp. MxC21-1]